MGDGLVKAFTDPAFNSTKLVPVDAVADVWQGNVVGATAGAGHFTVISGDKILAQVVSEPLSIAPRGRASVKAHATSTITPETSRYLMGVLPPAFKLKPVVVGEVPAKVLGFLPVTVTLHCEWTSAWSRSSQSRQT